MANNDIKISAHPKPSTQVEDAATSKLQNGDEALDFLQKVEVGNEADLVDERILVKKIDRTLVPLMFCCYFLQFLDKSLQDTHITTNQYANLALLFYIGFLAFEYPHAYLMQRLPTGKYLGCMVVCWGIIVTCTAACNSYAALAALRFLLGMFESAVSPALILISSMWYKRNEQPIRVGSWYIGVGSAVIAGALMSFGFQHYTGDTFRSWQIMFLVVGLLTIVLGAIVTLFMPDNPMSSRLTRAEKVLAVERLRENNTGIENKHFKLWQVKEALLDPQSWCFFLIVTAASIPNGAVGSFQSILLKSYGFTNQTTALLQLPSGVIAVSAVLTGTYTAGRYNIRLLNIMIWISLGGVLGGSLVAFGANQGTKLVGNYFTQFIGAFLPCLYSTSAGNIAGHTKKVTMNATLLIGFCLGNILGPLTFRTKDAPDFKPAKVTIVVTSSFAILIAACLWLYYMSENKRRDRQVTSHTENIEFADLTDRKNMELRYKY